MGVPGCTNRQLRRGRINSGRTGRLTRQRLSQWNCETAAKSRVSLAASLQNSTSRTHTGGADCGSGLKPGSDGAYAGRLHASARRGCSLRARALPAIDCESGVDSVSRSRSWRSQALETRSTSQLGGPGIRGPRQCVATRETRRLGPHRSGSDGRGRRTHRRRPNRETSRGFEGPRHPST